MSEATTDLVNWISANGKTVDLLIGVIIPVIVLITMDRLTGTISAGWINVENMVIETRELGATKEASDLPAKIVGGCLGVLALMMFALVFYNEEGKGLLAAFGLILLAMTLGIFSFLKIQSSRKAKGRAELNDATGVTE